MTNEEIIIKTHEHIKLRNLSHWTEIEYMDKLKGLLKYYENMPLEEMDETHLRAFLLYLLNEKKLAVATKFIAPPSGEPAPPILTPQPIANKIGTAGSQVGMSLYPAAESIETAIGVNKAHTMTFGKTVDNATLATSQTVTCDFIDGPTTDRAFSAMRRSRPVTTHVIVRSPEPKIKIILSDAYCAVTDAIGTIAKIAFAKTGTIPVTAICTGRVIHQKIIHKSVPTACAPGTVSAPPRANAVTAKISGPIRI